MPDVSSQKRLDARIADRHRELERKERFVVLGRAGKDHGADLGQDTLHEPFRWQRGNGQQFPSMLHSECLRGVGALLRLPALDLAVHALPVAGR